MTNTSLKGKKILIVEQGFLREEAFDFLNAQGIKADFLKIAPHSPLIKTKFHKIINVFNRLILKNFHYLEDVAFEDKNQKFYTQIYNKIDKKYDYILIIRPDNFNRKFIKYISKYGNLVFGYLWDSVNETKEKSLIKSRDLFEKIYCFDQNSISKYAHLKMDYATNFFYPIKEILNHIKPLEHHVISYVGQLANRRDIMIDKIIKKISNYILVKYDINIIIPSDFNKNDLVKNSNFKYLEHGISLHDYLYITANSSIVLDIQIDYQNGFTFRIFEASFYKKKIITTNPDVKNLEFYHPDNIFIYTENKNTEDINAFLEKPYNEIDENLINNYRLDFWLEKILVPNKNE